MPRYDGIVSLDEDVVQVIIDLDPDRVYLRAGDLEIGDWAAGECAIAALGDGAYSITAENQSLRFVPRNPRLFQDGLNHGTGYGMSAPPQPGAGDHHGGRHTKSPPRGAPSVKETEAPPPKPLTVALFYALAAATGALGIWALLSII
ncbi:MAG: hypothetical protein ACRDVL_10965 [Acidimicrobiia bacterium]